ncbi:MAG: 1-deoxy-D-xylulose-5-phosphate reductoisomerase, partial [Bacteroidota bacterium]|nr:1-deoxy-D-xylulose-5-phosphate reductoisomerase [Bacteroidota bacterium]
MNKKNIAILGSTGSIGTQTLEVIKGNKDLFQVFMLTAQSNADLLIQQSLEFAPAYAIICDHGKYQYVKQALANTKVKVLA